MFTRKEVLETFVEDAALFAQVTDTTCNPDARIVLRATATGSPTVLLNITDPSLYAQLLSLVECQTKLHNGELKAIKDKIDTVSKVQAAL